MEENESLEAAIRRELREETNLQISSMKQFRTYSDPNRDPRGHIVSTVYVCEAYGKLNAGDDAKNAMLSSIDEIDVLKDEFAFDHYQILTDYKDSIQERQSIQTEQELIWKVHYMSSYYDHDPRMPGHVPIDDIYHFVAGSKDEALKKAYRLKPKLRKLKGDDKIEVAAIPLDNLIVARDSKNDGRMGWHSRNSLAKVKLSSANDRNDYSLAVRLVPK